MRVSPVPAGAGTPALLAATDPEGLKPVVDVLTQTRQSLTLRSLLLTGFPHDPEFFAAGLTLAREWSRRGLKVAVVDLDFRHPTVVRHKPHPNEGYVDVLEYGCSYRRVAWELVADALWLVGPGSHPPDEERLADHPDWDRAIRVFSNQVDVALYLAPFLDRPGLAGRISKRMDGVLLVASVERVARSTLRDAFLELWGSDAPMIGSLGIEVRRAAIPAPPAPAATTPPAPARPAAVPAPAAQRVTPPAPTPPEPSWDREPDADATRPHLSDEGLERRIADEVRTGSAPRIRPRRGANVAILAGATLAVAAAVGAVGVVVKMSRVPSGSAPLETLPAGTEEVIPAQVGATGASVLPEGEAQRDSSPSEEPAAPIAAAPIVAAPIAAASAPQAADAPYRVHVASFRSMGKVEELVSSLRTRGLDAWHEPAEDRSGWYRVFVGHFSTRGGAARKAKWLLDQHWVDRAVAYPDTER
ncbi:MAG: SPOR domain-containing protein [Candidatus Latescibacteria bacterium]|nr:SPOR domain-containing protein [Candidatus Latescibacterota bacterium]